MSMFFRNSISLCSRWIMGEVHQHAETFDIYVIHNHLLPERRMYLEGRFDANTQVNFVEIEKQAPELLDELYAGINRLSWSSKCEGLWSLPPEPRALSRAEIACTASHFYAYQQFLKKSSKEWLLVIEDDALFQTGLERRIQQRINLMPDWVSALFVGGGFEHYQVSRTIGKYKDFFIKHHPATNTTVGYLLRRNLVERIMNRFDHFDLPIDYELAYLLMINNAVVLHDHPYLVSEGSKSTYQSSIRG